LKWDLRAAQRRNFYLLESDGDVFAPENKKAVGALKLPTAF
jgi:hypothetical protein